MSKLSKLVQVTDQEKKAILDHYKITEEEFTENVNILKEWISQSEHLPKEDGENKIRILLLNCKMSIEKAKQSLEGYYRVRTRYSNELFDKMVPNAKEYLESKRLVTTVVMPNLTPDLCRVTIFKMSDPMGEANDAYLYEIPVLMMAEMRVQKDLCLSNIIIIDFEEYGLKNLLKFTPTVNQKLVDILNAVNLRIHSVHFIHTPNFLDHVMRLIKSVLPAKLVGKINTHKSYESLYEYVPREYLPLNYGGTEKAIEELYDEWCEQIEESDELFQKLRTIKSTAKIELGAYQENMFGVEGSFKKLALD